MIAVSVVCGAAPALANSDWCRGCWQAWWLALSRNTNTRRERV